MEMYKQAAVVSEALEQAVVNSDAIAELRAQATLFKLLGRVIEQELDGELLQLLRGELKEPLAQVGVQPGAEFFEESEVLALEKLAEEYTGLFVAPGCISPYLSVFETGALYREPCDQVFMAYQQAGWDYQRRFSGEFPDHIGSMLVFVGVLYEMEADAVEAGDSPAAKDYARQRRAFTVELLGPWAPGWCQRASHAAFVPFYQQMLQLIEQLLWSELTTLVERRKLRELAEMNRREPGKLDYNADFRKASGI
jgi:TorA maturation chaperone TorD